MGLYKILLRGDNVAALLYAALFGCSVFNVWSSQKYARRSKASSDFLVYALITGAMAVVVFYVTSGFNIVLNTRTCIYGIVYAAVIFINYFFGLAIYKYMGIAETTFIRSGLSLILLTVSGIVFFNEEITLMLGIQIFLVLLTFLVIFLGKNNGAKAKGVTAVGLLLCLGGVVLGVICGIIAKLFAKDTEVTDQNSFFFITNVFIVAFALISVIFTNKFSIKEIGKKFGQISRFGYLLIMVNVLASNFQSILQIEILRISDLIIYTPLSGALGLLAGETVAVFIEKEKPRILATILAMSSVLVVLIPKITNVVLELYIKLVL